MQQRPSGKGNPSKGDSLQRPDWPPWAMALQRPDWPIWLVGKVAGFHVAVRGRVTRGSSQGTGIIEAAFEGAKPGEEISFGVTGGARISSYEAEPSHVVQKSGKRLVIKGDTLLKLQVDNLQQNQNFTISAKNQAGVECRLIRPV